MRVGNLQDNIEKTSVAMVVAVVAIAILNQPFFSTSVGTKTEQKEVAQPTQNISASARVKAFLAVIRYAEGTSGPNGYRTIYTGALFSGFARHPRQLQCANSNGRRLCSDAAGAYQFLSTTWEPLGLKDFSPANQDRGAIELLRRGGILHLVESGQFERAVNKAAPIWASLPNRHGQSAYGQPVKPMSQLRQIYETNLRTK